jgi:hypothetical protein
MITACCEPQFFQAQAAILKRCVDEEKWIRSEEAHHDVGWDAALNSFCEKYFQGFAAGFRAAYCGLVCVNRANCIIGQKYTVSLSHGTKI